MLRYAPLGDFREDHIEMKRSQKATTLKNCFYFAIYNSFSRLYSFFKVLSQIHNFVSWIIHMKCIKFDERPFVYGFYDRFMGQL